MLIMLDGLKERKVVSIVWRCLYLISLDAWQTPIYNKEIEKTTKFREMI